jgi:predicted nucleotidyltransferase component of viral defense system
MEQHIDKLIKLAKEIQHNFPAFYLAGGTNIMFKYKHRISTDLDFFSEKTFSFSRLINKFQKNFLVQRFERFDDNIDFWIKDIKVSFVNFPFRNIEKTQNFKGIKLASDKDIFLNKIYACGKRIDSKDIFDIAFLYKKYQYDFDEIKQSFEKKFLNQSFEIYLGSVFSLDDYPELSNNTKETILEIKKNWFNL